MPWPWRPGRILAEALGVPEPCPEGCSAPWPLCRCRRLWPGLPGPAKGPDPLQERLFFGARHRGPGLSLARAGARKSCASPPSSTIVASNTRILLPSCSALT